MEKLTAYLILGNLSQREFADRVGCSPSHLNEIIKKHKDPSFDLAERIEVASDGAVPMNSWPKIAALLSRVQKMSPQQKAS